MIGIPKRLIIALKSNKIILVMLPFLLVGMYIFSQYRSPLYLIDPKAPTIFNTMQLLSFDDKVHGGNSEIILMQAKPTIVQYKYTLREAKDFSKSNIRFTKKDGGYIDLSEYDYLKVSIQASNGTRIPFCISSFVPNHSRASEENSYIYASENLHVSPTMQTIEAPLNELTTPDWWYTSNHKTEQDFDRPDFSKVKYLYFSNCINLKKNIEDKVVITEASFRVNTLFLLRNAGLFLGIYFSIFLYIWFKKKDNSYHNIQKIYFQYKKIEDSNHQDVEGKTVLQYIQKHYQKPDLTIIDIQHAIGIHERKISQIVKTNTGLLFKQYLNILRIEEAKTLLKTSTLAIADIGYQVGYGNVSHFNRVFKEIVHCSPNDYRKANEIPNSQA
jgi:AraC-like DNA-binding protein